METSADLHYGQQLLQTAIEKAPEISRFLSRHVGEPSEAQDLLQELYLRVLKLKSSEEIRSPQAYLFRIAANLACEHRQRVIEQPPHVALENVPPDALLGLQADFVGASAPEAAAALAERIEGLRARLGQLSPKIQAAVIWHHRDGYTCDEIARKLSVVTHRMKKYLAKGLAHCREESGARTSSGRAPVPIYSTETSGSLYI